MTYLAGILLPLLFSAPLPGGAANHSPQGGCCTVCPDCPPGCCGGCCG